MIRKEGRESFTKAGGEETGAIGPATNQPCRGGASSSLLGCSCLCSGRFPKQSLPALVLEKSVYRRGDVVGLRKDGVFEFRVITAEGVSGGNALYLRGEVFEQFLSNAGGDFRPVAPAQPVFVRNDDAKRF